MIKFMGIKKKGLISFIIFENELKAQMEIPIAEAEAQRISLYLNKLAVPKKEMVEFLNDDPVDNV